MDKGQRVLFSTISLRIWINVRITLFFSIREYFWEEDKDILLNKWRLVKGGLSSCSGRQKEF